MAQRQLFGIPQQLPAGMLYQTEFISPHEEAELIAIIRTLPLEEAKYREFTAKRRIVTYGGTYDFSAHELHPAGPIPEFLHPLRQRIAHWAGVDASKFTHSLIAEYGTGTQLGWHRDVPDFEVVAGVSLASAARMRMRPYPPKKGRNPDAISVQLEARSAYILRGEARWNWQHSIPTTKALRYSITFRTLRS